VTPCRGVGSRIGTVCSGRLQLRLCSGTHSAHSRILVRLQAFLRHGRQSKARGSDGGVVELEYADETGQTLKRSLRSALVNLTSSEPGRCGECMANKYVFVHLLGERRPSKALTPVHNMNVQVGGQFPRRELSGAAAPAAPHLKVVHCDREMGVIAITKFIPWLIPLGGPADELQPDTHVRRLSGAAAAPRSAVCDDILTHRHTEGHGAGPEP
jgi:hypothetical protein